MFASVGASLSRKFLVSVLATGFFLGVSLVVAGVVGAQQTEQMNASWYGPGFEGATTASGEPFDPSGFTAAHKTLPFGTTMEVCYEGCVNVRINDRGPFIAGRDLDLAQGAAEAIGLTAVGEATVNVTYTDGSAPVGPSGGAAPTVQPEVPVAEPSQSQANSVPRANAAAGDQYDDDSTAEDQYADDDGSAQEEQYDGGDAENAAAADQYNSAAENQYEPPELADAGPDAGAAPEAPAPLAPPEPSAVEVAPLELATPGSTVERRIQLAVAAPPENYVGALPEDPPVEAAPTASVGQEAPTEAPVDAPDSEAARPESGSVAALAGMTVLPDTGGLPVMPLAGAALAASLMLVVGARAFRR